MKIWSSEHVFNHPWETVAQAAWRKYPNPMNPSVIGVDVLERKIDCDGKLRSHRVLTTTWGFPDWAAMVRSKVVWGQQRSPSRHLVDIITGERRGAGTSYLLIGLHPVTYASEHSEVDPKAKLLELKSTNVSLQNFISIDEKLSYSPHPTIENATLLKQEAVVTVRGLSLASRLEQMVTNTISSKASAGREGLELIIKKINEEVRDFKSTAEVLVDDMKNTMENLDFE